MKKSRRKRTAIQSSRIIAQPSKLDLGKVGWERKWREWVQILILKFGLENGKETDKTLKHTEYAGGSGEGRDPEVS